MLGRKSNWNWGKNSKKEIRLLEKHEFENEIHAELAEQKEDEEADQREKEYLDNHWINRLIAKKG